MDQADLVSVFRSSGANAEEDAISARALLESNRVAAIIREDSGTWKVLVAPGDAPAARLLVSSVDTATEDEPDPSPELDSVTIVELQGTSGEIEAMGIKSVLDANNIPSVIVGASTLPNLSFQVQVPAVEVERARAAIAEAEAAGPVAAVEAERATEEQNPG